MKDTLREMILEFHRSALPVMIHRDVEIPSLPSGVRKAFVFIGMRRVGKTFLMYQDMRQSLTFGLEKEKLLYLNFEDDRLSGFKVEDFQTILDVYFQLYPHLVDAEDLRIYFDEIQNIDGWEKFIRRLLDKEKMTLFITGSSAKLLSKEIATNLRGRCIENEVFPLSLAEYLAHKGVVMQKTTSKDRSVIRHHSENYLIRGGFPETLDLSDSMHTQVIQSYVNSAVFRDVIDRHRLKRPDIVKLFLIHCLQNIASPLSVTKVYNTFKSRGEALGRGDLYEFLHYFEDAYLVCTVPLFEYSTRKRQVNPSKIYCVDSGIIGSYSIKPETERSARLENAVYIQLRRMQFENIFYYKTALGKEVDFAAQYPNGKVELYQVSVDLSDEETRRREMSALVEAATALELKQAFVITTDTNETLEIDGLTIHVIPYWQWALGTYL
jgi:hypothetical protein